MTAHAHIPGTIGPNSITRMAQALTRQQGDSVTVRIFETAGLAHYLSEPPTRMVDEKGVTALHRVMRETLTPEDARSVSREAGHLTAEYLLANRIPKPVQTLLRLLPAKPASRILLAAISRNAWTFTGSGRFQVDHGRTLELRITGGPICKEIQSHEPVCDYYAATFEHLFQSLVHKNTVVRETACCAMGAPDCLFVVTWDL
ncbi:bacteriochlorophyll 4-vinyl reductase [Ectothiorhodospira lacustris]|uniref:bacteriochlorophyll 4-vinyl reductase n=1 Tax=Ectothiorhodospira lacustris TaxID=2899127 RepID=UPI001EE88CF4|nr:bacteriochlorophyll 4-vinyl reductase [Ectothiorhodospira lacustris]MCG5501920.1 bacteriochlorophyll 4-vinyl reductase [Ectothiorhodospira lacustris]MCG5509283.1 bacteriochlorophyll 4-vinyl reductase [Ectothiorhodospira lacustris]MCG5521337.1 bacteriochlorophyll 4-vinyl reductase [Ectothiorhodospira lacustris]